MEVVWLDAAEFWADTPSGVNEAGWYVQVDEGSYSGPYQSRDEAEQAIEMIRCGDVDDLPLIEAGVPPEVYHGPACGHSPCRQHWIDTGSTECVEETE